MISTCRITSSLAIHLSKCRAHALAGFKQQNAIHGLPLQLTRDEVTLAVEKGAGRLQ